MVPKFNLDEVDTFFDLFEKTARLKAWPKAEWITLIQGSITGRAQKAFAALNDIESAKYETVRKAVL